MLKTDDLLLSQLQKNEPVLDEAKSQTVINTNQQHNITQYSNDKVVVSEGKQGANTTENAENATNSIGDVVNMGEAVSQNVISEQIRGDH